MIRRRRADPELRYIEVVERYAAYRLDPLVVTPPAISELTRAAAGYGKDWDDLMCDIDEAVQRRKQK